MIVKDKIKSIELANDISSKLIKEISQSILKDNISDDPGEQIYLGVHIIGNLMSRFYLILENYSKIYNIEKVTKDKLKEWLNIIADENYQLNIKG